MRESTVRTALRQLATSQHTKPELTALPVFSYFDRGTVRVLFALDTEGSWCVLICAGTPAAELPVFRTQVLTSEFHPSVHVALDGRTEELAALVLRCSGGEEFADVFTALIDEIVRTLERSRTKVGWMAVAKLLERWSDFFRAPRDLGAEAALGLWGELWVLATSTDLVTVVDAWRGCEGATYDFFLQERVLEVKASTRRGIHHVSHAQVASDSVLGVLLSLEVSEDPEGLSLADLHVEITSRLESVSRYLEALRRRGVAPSSLSRHTVRRAIVSRPLVYRLTDVPRVTGVQPGVSNLSYVVTLDPSLGLRGADECENVVPFGLKLSK